MTITVELTYEMSRLLGIRRFEVEGPQTVQEILRLTRERFGDQAEAFDREARTSVLAVNGVLVNHRKGTVAPGDRVGFVKTASGG